MIGALLGQQPNVEVTHPYKVWLLYDYICPASVNYYWDPSLTGSADEEMTEKSDVKTFTSLGGCIQGHIRHALLTGVLRRLLALPIDHHPVLDQRQGKRGGEPREERGR